MIDERILNEFREHNTDPHYIVLITDMKNGEPVCNEESVIISTKQIFLSLEEYLQNPDDTTYKTVERDLTLYSNINLDDNDLYVGELNGYISKENVKYAVPTSNTQSPRWIEVVDTTLQKVVDITYNQKYKEQPKIFVNIDNEYEKLYRHISYNPIQNEKGEYIGTQVIFNNLKTKDSYPKIGIVIIGDEKTEKYDEEGNKEPIYHNLTVNLYYEETDEETGKPIQIPIEDTSILINDEEFTSNECGTITASLEEGEYEITVKESGYRYVPETVNLNSDKIIGLKLTPGITATFQTNLEDSNGNTIELRNGWDGTIDWGDGEISTIKKTDTITHTYNDEETEHTIFIKTSDFNRAFTENKALTSIKISNYTIKEFSVMGAFSNCSNLSSVIINAPTKTIPAGTFWACNFEKIILPDSIETINNAFGQNKALNNIVFPKSIKNLNIIGTCFTECDNLTQLVFPESITNLNIGEACFASCDNLNQVVFPKSMTSLSIGRSCFTGCTNLSQINFPESITNLNIGETCFTGCNKLNQIVFPESITNLNLGANCFSECTNLNQIIFPESIVNLNISGSLIGGTSIQQIILPKTVNPYILPTFCIVDNHIQQIILSDSITQLNTNSIGGQELHQISLPKSIGVISGTLSNTAFQQIILNWINEDIIPWRSGLYGSATLIIPPETKNNYIAKGYPEQRLVERVSDEDDSS